MDLGLKDAVVLVTGGSKGIGLACAHAFLAEGARVAIASRDLANLDAARQALAPHAVHVVPADLRDAAAAERMAASVTAALGPIEVLVNSAGAAKRSPAEELTAAHWHDAIDAKFFTYVHAMQAVIGGMAARGRGAVVNIAGAGGKTASTIHLPGGSANAALMLASAGLAAAYAARGVRVNAVNPGLVATSRMHEGFAAEARATGRSAEELHARAASTLPMGRICTAEEVASVVVFLASAQASYVSGAVLTVDGAKTPMVV